MQVERDNLGELIEHENASALLAREGFGPALRAIRQRRGLSLRDVEGAVAGELSGQAVSRIELGQRTPNARTLVSLARALNVRFEVDERGARIVETVS